MFDFNYWYIVLTIAIFCIMREMIGTFIDLEKWVFIYWEEKHSIDHIAYLSTYVFALCLYVIWEATGVHSWYFELMLWISTIILTRHLKMERNHKHK